jgi:tetratricopeptide (TPR) repeat protein
LDPKTYTAYRGFLKCIFTKDYQGALIDFKKAQELLPNAYEMDHTYPFYMGLCNLELGNYRESEEDFKQDILIQISGNSQTTIHFVTLFYVGVLYYEKGNYGMSIDYLLKCIDAFSEFPDANYYLALAYEKEFKPELRKKYLLIAKEAIIKGYSMNEDNIFYVNYPHQITQFEIEKELLKNK